MAKILLRHVAGFNRDQLLISKVSGLYRSKLPLQANPSVCCDHTRDSFLVSHLPMPYPNKIKRKKSTGIPSFEAGQRGRRCSLTFSIVVSVSTKRGSGASETHQNQGGDT